MTGSPTGLVVLSCLGRLEPALRIDGWRTGYIGSAPYFVLTTRGEVYRVSRSSRGGAQILSSSEFDRIPLVEQAGYLDEDRLRFPLIVPFYEREDGCLVPQIGRLVPSRGVSISPLCYGWSHARTFRASRDMDFMRRQVTQWAETETIKTGAKFKLFFCTPHDGSSQGLRDSVPFDELIAAGFLNEEHKNVLG